MWFRRDLRLDDLPALHAAIDAGPVAALFVFDDRLLNGRWHSPNRNAFLLECLHALDSTLQGRGTRLHIRHGDPRVVVPAFAGESGASTVFASRDYTPFATSRDSAVAKALDARGVTFHLYPGTLVQEPESVQTSTGQGYSVYGAFFRKWASLPRRTPLSAPESIIGVDGIADRGITDSSPWSSNEIAVPMHPDGGEQAAQERLANWTTHLERYAADRDRLDREGTSRLSQDLKFGTISPGVVLAAVERAGAGAPKFVSELAWREFYHHLVWRHPRMLDEPLRSEFAAVEWDANAERVQRWKDGQTGFPAVDAAMRQLLATGYMHNRARMIVASFLTKDLHIDWRVGQEHFMRHLVDGDVANNSGGWQWASSTGTDAQPYFRVFNPALQSKRFDPEGSYIRRWVPELRGVPARHIHEPGGMSEGERRDSDCILGRDYPLPMVDHQAERKRAITRFAEAKLLNLADKEGADSQ